MNCEPGESIGAWLCHAGQVLRAAAIENPRMEARWLLANAMGATPETLLREPRAPVPPEAARRFTAMLARRAQREPMAHILGQVGFWGMEFAVSQATLIPRADSETIVQAALDAAPAPQRVLDLGTGTGCLLLAVLSERPGAWGLGLDLVPEAAALAASNAARLGLAHRAAFIAGDWSAALDARFDLVLSNPPYIPAAEVPGLMPEVAAHEPATALAGGADGLVAYRALAQALPRLLAPGGVTVLEIGQGQGSDVMALMHAAGLQAAALLPDLGGIPRALVLKACSAVLKA
jgi:release factor glutamine methyltransferase